MVLSRNRGRFAAICRLWVVLLPVLLGENLVAQEHEEDHDHGQLHFSHPMVTESPTPDTKIRLDYVRTRVSGVDGTTVDGARIEGEFAFSSSLSLAVSAPYLWVRDQVGTNASGLGDTELSLKAAKILSSEHHVLGGGGISAGLPTGSDAKGIGSSHLVEIEPFLDAAYKRDALELAGFARLASVFRRRPTDDNERNLAFDFSSLYRIHANVEALIEASTVRSLVGPNANVQQTFIAPGLKVYPFRNRQMMFGGSVLFGTGVVSDTRGLLLSAFYHF